MEEKSIILNQYELETLKTSIESYVKILDDQVTELKKVKHLSSDKKKDITNHIGKTKDLLKSVLTKL
ncbi:MAG: hypothetical protein NDI94_01080 [Candidatus Woesearchaeota archaeon]|nr:hypothetical protein [Candidatus Woesearchaeota archaeon]